MPKGEKVNLHFRLQWKFYYAGFPLNHLSALSQLSSLTLLSTERFLLSALPKPILWAIWVILMASTITYSLLSPKSQLSDSISFMSFRTVISSFQFSYKYLHSVAFQVHQTKGQTDNLSFKNVIFPLYFPAQ